MAYDCAIVYTDLRFSRNKSGDIVSSTTMGYQFFARYLDLASTVVVVARVGGRADRGQLLSGNFVSVRPLITDQGRIENLLSILRVFRLSLADARSSGTISVFRLPSPAGAIVSIINRLLGGRYLVEVIGDAEASLSKIGPRLRGRSLIGLALGWAVRRSLAGALGVSYVTRHSLQKRYPTRARFCSHYSSVELPDEWILRAPRDGLDTQNVRILSVGSMDRMYKRFDLVLEACARVQDRSDIKVEVCIVGGGRLRQHIENIAERNQSLDVSFVGLVPQTEMLTYYDWADIFLLMSDTEGLPRVAVEAQARGVPVVLTDVGGNREIGDPDLIVPAGDAEKAASLLLRLIRSREFYRSKSELALGRVEEYRTSVLVARRRSFFERIADGV